MAINLRRLDPAQWFALIDARSQKAVTPQWLEPEGPALGEAGCTAPANRHPRGFDVRQNAEGEWRIAVVTEGAGADAAKQNIEYFALIRGPAGSTMRWAGCVNAPPDYFLNDVALGPKGELYATHMYQRETGWRAELMRPKFALGIDTGFAVAWDTAKGWRKVEGTEGSFPNGISLDPTGSVLFVAYTYEYSEGLVRVDLLSGARTTATLPLRPDNLAWTLDPQTKDLSLTVAGGIGVRLLSTTGCAELQRPGCGFAFAVAQIDTKTMAVRTIFKHDTFQIAGASVATRLGDKLYIGSAFGDRVSIVPVDDGGK
ncbi:MAG: hypothetical protein EXR11_12800 [Rhodospirillaceae bacterium]|nr:hypothetical protein [Rhodospirillaceae bacterium]